MAFPPLLSLASDRHASRHTHSGTSSDSPALSVPAAPAAPAFDTELWSRLEAMQLDWSLSCARAVIALYRRFLYLAARAGHPVSPSDAVGSSGGGGGFGGGRGGGGGSG